MVAERWALLIPVPGRAHLRHERACNRRVDCLKFQPPLAFDPTHPPPGQVVTHLSCLFHICLLVPLPYSCFGHLATSRHPTPGLTIMRLNEPTCGCWKGRRKRPRDQRMDGWVGGSVSECKVKFNILPASAFLPSPPKGKLAGWRDQKSYPGPHSRLTLGTAASGRSRERERNSWEEAPPPTPCGGRGLSAPFPPPTPRLWEAS